MFVIVFVSVFTVVFVIVSIYQFVVSVFCDDEISYYEDENNNITNKDSNDGSDEYKSEVHNSQHKTHIVMESHHKQKL